MKLHVVVQLYFARLGINVYDNGLPYVYADPLKKIINTQPNIRQTSNFTSLETLHSCLTTIFEVSTGEVAESSDFPFPLDELPSES